MKSLSSSSRSTDPRKEHELKASSRAGSSKNSVRGEIEDDEVGLNEFDDGELDIEAAIPIQTEWKGRGNQGKDDILKHIILRALEARRCTSGSSHCADSLPVLQASGDSSPRTKKLSNDDDASSALSSVTAPLPPSSVTSEFEDKRPYVRDGALYTLVYVVIILVVLIRWMVLSIIMSFDDGYWYRCTWFIFIPLYFSMALFPFRIAIYNVLALLGSWRNMSRNSTYHSAIAPPIPAILPPVCVQMPVYKESFSDTIQPSLEDIEKALEHYRLHGGDAFMFVNDDGLQLIDEEDRNERLRFYHEHNIAYIARPPPNVLARAGLFKKASNMNFCLNFALDVAHATKGAENDEDEGCSEATVANAIQHVKESRPYPVLVGGPVHKMAEVEYILLVDSDTRVPLTCLRDTVGEFMINPTVGFVQHATSVLRVDCNYWEDMLAHFTSLLYSVFIPMGTSNGEPSPLVGHNATLNWKAVQRVSRPLFEDDDECKHRKFWSEAHVSEDFDLSLRLQSEGYIGRYATYTGDGFREGVSVTVHDEIKKLKKFAFGSGEILFHPFRDWFCKGPISPLLKAYLFQPSIPLHAKVSMIGYLFTYVAMAFGVLSFPQLFFVAVLDGNDQNLPTPWELEFGTILIFSIIGSSNIIVLTFLLGHHTSIWVAIAKEMKNLLQLGIFYTGVQYHIFTSFFRYMFSMKAEWGATVKELEDAEYSFSTFMGEVAKCISAYWDMYVFVIAMACFFAYFFMFGPSNIYWSGYAMSLFCIFMAAQATMPIILNPTAMRCLYVPLSKLLCCFKGGNTKDSESSTSVQMQSAEDDVSNATKSRERVVPSTRSASSIASGKKLHGSGHSVPDGKETRKGGSRVSSMASTSNNAVPVQPSSDPKRESAKMKKKIRVTSSQSCASSCTRSEI